MGLKRRPTPSLFLRLSVIAFLFLFVPILIYLRLEEAAQERDRLLLNTVQAEARLIGAAVAEGLSSLPSHQVATGAQPLVETLAAAPVEVRILYRPQAGGVFLVASAPAAADPSAEQERLLTVLGEGFEEDDCSITNRPLSRRLAGESRSAILASRIDVPIGEDCWTVLTATTAIEALGSGIDRPYWATPQARLAFIIYLGMAVLVLLILLDAVRSVHDFARVARRKARREPGVPRFSQANRLPELDDAAEAFDQMVDGLARSAAAVRESAEETAHAFKAPLATMGQALDMLERRMDPGDDATAQRALSLARQSQTRMLDLVTTIRRLEDAVADQMDPPRDRVDVTTLLQTLATAAKLTGAKRDVGVTSRIADGLHVLGSAPMLEAIIDNPLENALSFTPPGGRVGLLALKQGDEVVITLLDSGPGVPPSHLAEIFDRYYSRRSGAHADDGPGNFGIGLWVARRNAEALGGSMIALNRPTGGLEVEIRLPSDLTELR